MIRAEYIIVGSGLTGSVIARQLADAGREVVVLERRPELGGNVVDATHEPSGIRYGKYGPHYFRTSSDRIWEYATRFADFFPYEARVLSLIDGELVPWPPQRAWIEKLCGKDWQPEFTGTPQNFEEACLSMMPRLVYSKAVEPYNLKQWGKPCTQLSASLCKRFDVRDGDDRLTPNAKHQGLPREGYSAWMANMLKGIDVRLGFDYLRRREEVEARRMLVFTGPIDEYYGFRLGRLEYRAQRRHEFYYEEMKTEFTAAQINTPQPDFFCIRQIDWRKLMPPDSQYKGAVITSEFPYSPSDVMLDSPADPDAYEYPMPDEANARLYQEYRKLSQAEEKTVFAGRLGSYKYLDMDQSIAHGMCLADKLLEE